MIEYYSSDEPAVALILFEKSVNSKQVLINQTESVSVSNSRSLEGHQSNFLRNKEDEFFWTIYKIGTLRSINNEEKYIAIFKVFVFYEHLLSCSLVFLSYICFLAKDQQCM